MAANIDTMAYNKVNGVPWHGVGVAVDGLMTADEAIVKGQLGWGVGRDPIYVRDPADPTRTMEVEGVKAIRRLDNGRVLSVMSNGYRPVPNQGKFDFMDAVVGDGLARYETVMSLDGGKKVALLAKLPGEIRIEGTDDVTNKYLLLADSFDGSIAYTGGWTTVRVVCQNTLNAALSGMKASCFKLRHTVNVMDKVEEAKRVLGFVSKQMEVFNQEANRLAKTRFSEKQMVQLAAQLFPSKEGEEVSARSLTARTKLQELFAASPGSNFAPGTAWQALQAVTDFADHYRSTRKTGGKSEQEARASSALFGSGVQFKQEAVQAIYQLAA